MTRNEIEFARRQIAFMRRLRDTYYDHMEGANLAEFLKYEKLYAAASPPK